MSQQEDDLRALAKIMDFLRAISIVLVVANLYFLPVWRPLTAMSSTWWSIKS